MGESEIWPVCVEAYRAISQHYVQVMDKKAAEYQLPEGGGWLLLPALTFDQDPISADKLRIRSPYTSERRYQAGLEALTASGFLVAEPGNAQVYHLSPAGREAILAVIQTGYTCMGSLQPLDTAKLESLSSILFKLVEACLDASEPPGKWSITHSRKIDPGENAAVMVRIDQYLSDLAAYRDDAHLAAWQKHACSGHAWELLTVFWREGAQVFDDLFQRLAPRGYLSEETRAALTDLVDRNWVQLEDDIYRLTNLGQQVRVDAEAETDRFFYQPWSCLSNQENITVQDLVSKMKNALDVSREA